MNTKDFLKGSLDPMNISDALKFKREFRREHPEYFDPDGIICFCGPQGSGKTISAVNYVLRLAAKYPDMVCVSNVLLPTYPEPENLIQFAGMGDLITKFRGVSNGYAGVVYLVDEIQLLFNSLESKNIDMSVITEISQQRKQRKHIVGTAQVFQRLAKPFREQFKYAVLCRCFLGCVQFNTLVDGATSVEDASGHIKSESIKRYFWFHNPKLYEAYDTYAKIEKGSKDTIY